MVGDGREAGVCGSAVGGDAASGPAVDDVPVVAEADTAGVAVMVGTRVDVGVAVGTDVNVGTGVGVGVDVGVGGTNSTTVTRAGSTRAAVNSVASWIDTATS